METVATEQPQASPPPASSPRPAPPAVGPWLARAAASGTGVAIAINGADLDILLVRVRPAKVQVLAYQRFAGGGERPAADVGAEYRRFLASHGVAHLPAHVLLPRQEVIVRTPALPGVREKDLDAALALQLESLHPYADDTVSHGHVRIGKSPSVLVGICREEYVDRWIAFFEDAGIKLAAFTFSADVLYRAARVLRTPPAAFLCPIEAEDAVEIYGESPARPLYDTFLYAHAAQAAVHAQSELRVEEEAPVLAPEELLALPETEEQIAFVRQHPLLYATALSAAGVLPQPAANLLPADLRKSSNWAILLPTLALAALLALLVGGSFAQQAWYEQQYRQRLDAEILQLQQRVAEGNRIDAQGERFLARLDALRRFKTRSRQDLDTLLELTNLLPPSAWITQADINRDQIVITGEADEAGDLIRILDASPLFVNSEFAMPLQRAQDREIYRMRANREFPPEAAAPAASAAATPAQAPAATPAPATPAPALQATPNQGAARP